MNFTVYSKDGCPYCEKVKMVLEHISKDEKYDFVEYKLNKNFTRDEFYFKFGQGSTFPQVVVDGNNLGGCSDTISYLKENNII